MGVCASVSGTSVTLRETVIENTQPDENGMLGYGIQVADGASLDAAGCAVGDNTALGVAAYDSGTSVTLQETAVEDTRPNQNDELGYGILVTEGASLDAEGCEVLGNTYAGVIAYDSGTSVSLRETAIEHTQPDDKGQCGYGIGARDGASLDAEGCALSGNSFAGVFASGSGTSVRLQGTTIEDTLLEENGEHGCGIRVSAGASLDAEACELQGNASLGVAAFDAGTAVALRESATAPKGRADQRCQRG